MSTTRRFSPVLPPTSWSDCDFETTTVSLTACDKPACQSFYRTASYGTVVCTELRHNGEVVDLLLNLLMAAARRIGHKNFGVAIAGSGPPRPPPPAVPVVTLVPGAPPLPPRAVIPPVSALILFNPSVVTRELPPPAPFEPFPYGLGFDHNGVQNVQLLVDTVDLIPPVRSMLHFQDDVDLKAFLDAVSPLLFPLLKWVICSNRQSMSLVPSADCLEDLHTPFQFKILSTNPGHERCFKEYCQSARLQTKGEGFYRAFHASPMANWHSVLRAGLQCSPTGALGPGVYAHEYANYSQAYMCTSPVGVWKNSMFNPFSSTMSMMSLVEVADHRHNPTLIIHQAGNNAITDFTLVVVRYLFFYPQGPTKALTAMASKLPVQEDVLADYCRVLPPQPRLPPAPCAACAVPSPLNLKVQNLASANQLHSLKCVELRAYIRNHSVKAGPLKQTMIDAILRHLQPPA